MLATAARDFPPFCEGLHTCMPCAHFTVLASPKGLELATSLPTNSPHFTPCSPAPGAGASGRPSSWRTTARRRPWLCGELFHLLMGSPAHVQK